MRSHSKPALRGCCNPSRGTRSPAGGMIPIRNFRIRDRFRQGIPLQREVRAFRGCRNPIGPRDARSMAHAGMDFFALRPTRGLFPRLLRYASATEVRDGGKGAAAALHTPAPRACFAAIVALHILASACDQEPWQATWKSSKGSTAYFGQVWRGLAWRGHKGTCGLTCN